VLLLLVIFLITRDNGVEPDELAVDASPSATESASENPSDDPTAPESESGTSETESPVSGPAQEGTVTVDGTPILPLPEAGLAEFAGGAAEGQSVPVQSVVSDDGFWVGSSETDRLFVFLDIGEAEPPPPLELGEPISISGTLEPAPADPETEFGIRAEDGLAQLMEQGYYLRVLSIAAG